MTASVRRALRGEAFTAVVAFGEVAVETWFSPLRDHQGSVTGAMGVSLDVTTRQRLERQYVQAQKMEASVSWPRAWRTISTTS